MNPVSQNSCRIVRNSAAHLMRALGLFLLSFLIAVPAAQAMPQPGHYFSGANGLMSAVPMPAGFTYVNNIFVYNTDTLKDEHGDSTDIGSVNVFVNGFTPFWTAETKILDATYSCMALIPLQNVEMGNFMDIAKQDYWGLGDVLINPLMLTWEPDDTLYLTFRYGFFAPTGRYSLNGTDNIGLGYWTNQFVAGGTWFFGPEDSWHISSLNRVEIHSGQEGHDLRPGSNFVSEWGFGKTLVEGLDVGITGYANIQIEPESGSARGVDRNLYRVFALGGEISWHVPDTALVLKTRCNKEFGARNRAEGLAATFTLAYHF